jgi:hypothetical protein
MPFPPHVPAKNRTLAERTCTGPCPLAGPTCVACEVRRTEDKAIEARCARTYAPPQAIERPHYRERSPCTLGYTDRDTWVL